MRNCHTFSALVNKHEGPFYWMYTPAYKWELRTSEGGFDHITYWPVIVDELFTLYGIDPHGFETDENGDPNPTNMDILSHAYRCFPRGRVVRGEGNIARIIVGDMPQSLSWDLELEKLVSAFRLGDWKIQVESKDSHETVLDCHRKQAEGILNISIPGTKMI